MIQRFDRAQHECVSTQTRFTTLDKGTKQATSTDWNPVHGIRSRLSVLLGYGPPEDTQPVTPRTQRSPQHFKKCAGWGPVHRIAPKFPEFHMPLVTSPHAWHRNATVRHHSEQTFGREHGVFKTAVEHWPPCHQIPVRPEEQMVDTLEHLAQSMAVDIPDTNHRKQARIAPAGIVLCRSTTHVS